MKMNPVATATAWPLLLLTALLSTAARAEVIGPYTPDANTLHLWHFDETSGGNDPGNPFVDAVGSAAHNLTNTGGFNSRSNTTTGGYGGMAYSGFGSSFDPILSGSGVYHGSTSAIGGGATTGAAVAQTTLQGSNGAYTWEALVFVSGAFNTPNSEYTILSHDGGSARGPMLRVLVDGSGNRTLNWYNGGVGLTLAAPLPTTGAHEFEDGEWFHVAAAYTGEAGADNFKLYWTALDSGASEANLLASLTQTADALSSSNLFGVGTTTRSPFRFEWVGLIDEVRISDIARGPGDFLFVAVPEPSSLVLFSVMGLLAAVYAWRRRK